MSISKDLNVRGLRACMERRVWEGLNHLMNESGILKGVETLHLYHTVSMSCAHHVANAIPYSMTRPPQP